MREGRQFSGLQSQGARDYQEDSWGWHNRRPDGDDSPSGLLVVLADGMGGHQGGARASAIAVDSFIAAFAESSEPVPRRLEAALMRANERIRSESAADESLHGMGCTLLAASFGREGMHWISVGDSPLWLVRNGSLRRLNEDHSMAPVLQAKVAEGELTAEEAGRHPQRNALRSALIGERVDLVDLAETPLPLEPGDRVLLASDGVETLSVEEIAQAVAAEASADSSDVARRLITAVDEKQRRGQDNATVVVVSPFLGVRDGTILVGRGRGTARRRLTPVFGLGALLIAGALVAWLVLGRGPEPPATGGTPGVALDPAVEAPAPAAGGAGAGQ